MTTRQLGTTGPTVGAVGSGAWACPGSGGPPTTTKATIRAAVETGVTLVDTGDFYAMGHNQLLIGRALDGLDRDDVALSVKFGALRPPGGGAGGFDGRPEAVGNFLSYSLVRLGVDRIDIYGPARLDPNVPIEDTPRRRDSRLNREGLRAPRRAVRGRCRHDPAAVAVHPIADLQ